MGIILLNSYIGKGDIKPEGLIFMKKNKLSVEAFNEQLSKWNGKDIKIVKQEMNDIDEIFISLETINFSKNDQRLDDYEPLYVLQLNGEGKVKTTDNHSVPLPSPLYEIPIEDETSYQFDGTVFTLTTDRGVYTIEIAPIE